VWPNPFRATVTIDYVLPRNADVALDVHDVLGREIRVIERAQRTAGTYSASWDGRATDGRPVMTGVYFIRLRAGRALWLRPVVRIR
jgi:flagellar hook assembly protein FlgD